MRRLAVVLATLVALAALVPAGPALAAAAGPGTVSYRPPVDAPVVDPFRPPDQNWNAGNRGLEYATSAGGPVAASAAGEVVFAGPVAGGLHVVVLHDDGLRTSYSFLRSIAVRRGDKVGQGQTLGTAQERFHFGVRAGDAYLDPARLFGDGRPEVHLVPDEVRRPQSEAHERAGLARMVAGWSARALAGGTAAVAWAKDAAGQQIADHLDELRGAVHFAREAQPLTHAARFAVAAHDWWKARETCTPPDEPIPSLGERRLLVTVAGLGSTSTKGAVDEVDTARLGYAGADVVRFSYRGGTTAERPYTAADTTADMNQSARHLRQLLERLQAEHPGVPVDVIAHSQGGVVARAALSDEVDGADPRLPAVKSLVTIGTPHRGAPIATALTMAGHTTTGEALGKAAHAALPDLVDPRGPSIAQLAEESEFMRRLHRRPMPAGMNVTSIGGRDDLVVPAGVTRLDGARNVIVSPPGILAEHSDLPGAAATHREIALGLAGREPTCQGLGDALADALVSDAIRQAETAAGTAAWAGGHWADRRVQKSLPTPTVPRRSE